MKYFQLIAITSIALTTGAFYEARSATQEFTVKNTTSVPFTVFLTKHTGKYTVQPNATQNIEIPAKWDKGPNNYALISFGDTSTVRCPNIDNPKGNQAWTYTVTHSDKTSYEGGYSCHLN